MTLTEQLKLRYSSLRQELLLYMHRLYPEFKHLSTMTKTVKAKLEEQYGLVINFDEQEGHYRCMQNNQLIIIFAYEKDHQLYQKVAKASAEIFLVKEALKHKENY